MPDGRSQAINELLVRDSVFVRRTVRNKRQQPRLPERAMFSHSDKRGCKIEPVRPFLAMAYAATTTIVIVIMPRLHVQVIAVAIDSRGMVIVVTASAISADAVRPIPIARITSVTD